MHRTDTCVKCGMVKPGYNRYGKGHQCFNCARKTAYPVISRSCACGCGEVFDSTYNFKSASYTTFVRGHNEKKWRLTRTALIALYDICGMNKREIAKFLSVHIFTVKRYFKLYGIRARTQSECRTGERNSGWLGGGYSGFRGPGWEQIKRAVRRRDKRCKRCGKTPRKLGYKLHVHHKVPYRVSHDNSMTNLEGLCRRCHKIAEYEYWRSTK